MRNVDEISYEYVIKIHGYKHERHNCCISNLLVFGNTNKWLKKNYDSKIHIVMYFEFSRWDWSTQVLVYCLRSQMKREIIIMLKIDSNDPIVIIHEV